METNTDDGVHGHLESPLSFLRRIASLLVFVFNFTDSSYGASYFITARIHTSTLQNVNVMQIQTKLQMPIRDHCLVII